LPSKKLNNVDRNGASAPRTCGTGDVDRTLGGAQPTALITVAPTDLAIAATLIAAAATEIVSLLTLDELLQRPSG
jgi:hypothetical protein